MDISSREAIQSKFCCCPSEKGSTLNGRNLLSKESDANAFPFRVDPLSEGAWCAGKQTGSCKNDLPYQIRQKFY